MEGELPKFWEPVRAPGFVAGAPRVAVTPGQVARVQGLPRPVRSAGTALARARPPRFPGTCRSLPGVPRPISVPSACC